MGEPYEQQTLEALKSAGFNKVRMCLLPKPLGQRKPFAMPFEHAGPALRRGRPAVTKSKETFDLTRLNPAYFRHVEKRIQELLAIGGGGGCDPVSSVRRVGVQGDAAGGG